MFKQSNIVFLLGISFISFGCVTETTGDKQYKSTPKTSHKAYYDLGTSYMKKGRFDLAEPKLLRSLESKRTADGLNALALLYEEIHDNIAADDTYEKLISEFPEYGRGLMNYNIFLCKYDRQDQITSLTTLMSSKGSDMAALGQIAAGDCALSKGRAEKATEHYNNALAFEKYSIGALLPLAEIDFNNGYFKEAGKKIDVIHNQIAYTAKSLYLAINIARELSDYSKENRMKRELRARYPKSIEAKNIGL